VRDYKTRHFSDFATLEMMAQQRQAAKAAAAAGRPPPAAQVPVGGRMIAGIQPPDWPMRGDVTNEERCWFTRVRGRGHPPLIRVARRNRTRFVEFLRRWRLHNMGLDPYAQTVATLQQFQHDLSVSPY